jgi:hypothetical protein
MKMKLIQVVGSIAIVLLSSSSVWATPAQVLVIRHGEKPPKGHDLSPAGQARAEALVGLFEKDPRFLAHGTPVAIYAMLPSQEDEANREVETVTPLAMGLGLQINEHYIRDQYPQMATEILTSPAYEGKMVLICWDHAVIPQIVAALGVTNPMPAWPSGVFDRVLAINYGSNGNVTSFDNLPQRLMPNDSPQ